MKFYNRHAIRRELLKLTQKDIGDRLKIAASTISVYERGGEGLSEFVIQAIRDFYDRLPDELGLDANEKRYLRIAENAVCLFEEKAPGFRVKYASSVIIDCGHAINEETKPKDLDKNKGEQNVKYGKRTGKVYIG